MKKQLKHPPVFLVRVETAGSQSMMLLNAVPSMGSIGSKVRGT